MASIVAIDKTPAVPAVPEKVHGATIKLSQQDIAYLTTGMEYAYKAHKADLPGYYVSASVSKLYKQLKAAYDGKSALTAQDFFTTRTF